MNNQSLTITGGPIFDGNSVFTNSAAHFENGIFQELVPHKNVAATAPVLDLEGDILSPGYVDLQVNGGDGVMFNDAPTLETLTRIANAHRKLGTQTLLPTLITDTADKTRAAIEAAQAAIAANIPGIAGLHLEGPHLSVARKGAHDASYIRPMEDSDLQLLLAAKTKLPVLKVTIAPENVTTQQVRVMVNAGLLVSLGHTDADFNTCMEYSRAGTRCATHLFNAMSQLDNRQPGLVGAALACGDLSAGLIADGIHVHPSVMQITFSAKAGPGRIYLVSDAMAVAGSDKQAFTLGGRRILRSNGRLTLEDGTLAGADLDLTTAIRVITQEVGVPLETALQSAISVPAALINRPVTFVQGVTSLSSLLRISKSINTTRWLA